MLSNSVNNTREAQDLPLEVRHYGKEPGSFELYEDDGKTFDHEKGEFGLRSLRFENGKGSEAIVKNGPRLFGNIESWVEMTK